MSSTAAATPIEGFTPELTAWYTNRRRMWRNIAWISVCNLGWSLGPTLFNALQQVTLYDLGWTEKRQGFLNMSNSWLLAFLVMYFSWLSDHTVTRVGRRKLYLILSAPFIIIPNLLFPFFDNLVTLVIFMMVATLFSDLKASTFPLINIDCMPRSQLGRAGAVLTIISGLLGFIFQFWGASGLHQLGHWVPFVCGGAVMTCTTLCALLIREPPIYHPTAKPFRPWSALAVGLRQRSNIIIFLGCGMIHSFQIAYGTWVVLFATKALGLDWQEVVKALAIGPLVSIALAYPIGWAIDRLGGLRMVVVFWVMNVVCWLWSLQISNARDLVIMGILLSVTGPLYAAADILVYRNAAPQDVGSVTSSNSFFRNLYWGLLGGVTGMLITVLSSDGSHSLATSYRWVFTLGMIMCTVGFILYFIHRTIAAKSLRPTGSIT